MTSCFERTIDGWVCAIRPTNLFENLKGLKISKDAIIWLKEEISRFKEMILGKGLLLNEAYAKIQDGGEIIYGVLELMDTKTWEMFNEKFLKT